MTLQMTLDLRVTQLEEDPAAWRAVLLCNGKIIKTDKVAAPSDSLFLLRQFLFPRADGTWREIKARCNHTLPGPDSLLAWLSGGYAGSLSTEQSREAFNWLDGDVDAVSTMCQALANRVHGTQYDVRNPTPEEEESDGG